MECATCSHSCSKNTEHFQEAAKNTFVLGSFWCLTLSSQFFYYIFKTVYTYLFYYIQSSIMLIFYHVIGFFYALFLLSMIILFIVYSAFEQAFMYEKSAL